MEPSSDRFSVGCVETIKFRLMSRVSAFYMSECQQHHRCQFRDILRYLVRPDHRCCRNTLSKTPYGAWFLAETHFYTDAVPTELKRGLKSSRFPRRIRFGCKPNLPDLGTQTVIFSKIDTYGANANSTYRSDSSILL